MIKMEGLANDLSEILGRILNNHSTHGLQIHNKLCSLVWSKVSLPLAGRLELAGL